MAGCVGESFSLRRFSLVALFVVLRSTTSSDSFLIDQRREFMCLATSDKPIHSLVGTLEGHSNLPPNPAGKVMTQSGCM